MLSVQIVDDEPIILTESTILSPDTEIELDENEIPEGSANITDATVVEDGDDVEVDIQGEEIPAGPADLTGIEEVDTEISEEDVPGGALPKTGGITPMLVYGVGIALFGSGIALYRKKEEE